MSAIPDAVKALLLAQRPHHCWDLWTFTLVCGVTLRWTSADIDLTVNGETYLSEIVINRGKCALKTGVENSTQEVTLSPGSLDDEPAIAGIPMRQAIRSGLFDGAGGKLQWVYFELGAHRDPIGTIIRFNGTVGEINGFKSKAVMTLNSPLKRLDVQIPWKTYGAGCRYILGDADCGVSITDHATSGVVGSGSTNGTIVTTLDLDDGDYALGTVLVTSGEDAYFRRTIRTNVGGTLYLKTPLPWAPESGDAITVYPGCDKSAPTLASASQTATIPSGLTIQGATSETFAADGGVVMAGVSTTTTLAQGTYEEYDVYFDTESGYWKRISTGEWLSYWTYSVTTTGASTTMTAVTGTPATGQYSVSSSGLYTFASADIGRNVTISTVTATGGACGCQRFHNVGRYGGMPYIPSPETAY